MFSVPNWDAYGLYADIFPFILGVNTKKSGAMCRNFVLPLAATARATVPTKKQAGNPTRLYELVFFVRFRYLAVHAPVCHRGSNNNPGE